MIRLLSLTIVTIVTNHTIDDNRLHVAILHVMKDSLALYLSLCARMCVCVCVCERDKATASRALHTRVYGTSNTTTMCIHSDELKNKMIIIL